MAWTLIDGLDAPTSGTFIFSPLDLSGYDIVQIILSGIRVTTDGTLVRITFYVGGVEITSGYRWGVQGISASGTAVTDGDTSDPSILLGSDDSGFTVGNAATESFGAIITLDNPLSTALYKKASFESWYINTGGQPHAHSGAGIMENAGAINGLKVLGSSNLTAGKVRILGL